MTLSGGGSRARKRARRADVEEILGRKGATRLRRQERARARRNTPSGESRWFRTNPLRAVHSISEVKEKAKSCGSHFFDKDTMRFFNSRIVGNVINHSKDPRIAYFVTSEKRDDEPRLYTVRKQIGCRIESASKFQEFGSAAAAKRAALRLARKK